MENFGHRDGVLARAMLARVLDAGTPVSWISADEAYGMDYGFRHLLPAAAGPPRHNLRTPRANWSRPATYAIRGATIEDLVRVAGARWAIEPPRPPRTRNETGLDQHQLRR